MLELAILGLLKEQPLHGYELKKRVGEMLGFLWGVSYGSLYPALARLEKAGAIEVVDPATATPSTALGTAGVPMPATGSIAGEAAAAKLRRIAKPTRRTRKAYRITDRGQALFAELLEADVAPGADEERSFTLKLAFCQYLPPSARLDLLQRRRTNLVDRLTRTRRAAPGRGDQYTRSLMEHRTQSTERDLEWVEQLIAAEQQSRPKGATA